MQAFASHFPIACLGFKSSPGAGCAWGVGPVARQQDSDMHFVGFALKPLEKAVASAETLIAQRQNDLANVRAALADNALYSEENKVRLKQTLAQEARIQSELAHAEEDWLHASARLDAARDVLTKSDTTAD